MSKVTLRPATKSKQDAQLLHEIVTGKIMEVVVAFADDAIYVRNTCGEVEVKYADAGNVYKSLPVSVTSQPLQPGDAFRFAGTEFKVTNGK